MKFLYKSDACKIAVAMLITCSGLFLAGCSKDKEDQIIDQPSGDGTKIKITVIGVSDGDNIAVNTKAASSSKIAVRATAPVPQVRNFNGFDAVATLEENAGQTGVQAIGKSAKGLSAAADLRAAAIASNVKYRFLLYKTDGTFVSSTSLTSASTASVDVEKGKSYKWYAISYNDTTTVPDVADRNNPTLVLPGNKDVLFTSGNINTAQTSAAGDTPLGLTFKHRFARIGIEINTQGMFADVENLGVKLNGLALKTGTLNLKTGALTNLTAYTNDITSSSFTNVETTFADRKIAYAYTADSTAANAFSVSVNNLSVKLLEGGTTRSFTSLATTPSTFNFSTTPVIGRSATATVNFLESALTVGGVKWARGNLYLSTEARNPYRFQQTYESSTIRNSYFPYLGTKPTAYDSRTGDPCAEVYPTGVWRTPTAIEFSGIVSSTPTNVAGTGGYLSYTTTSTGATPYPGNDLRFYKNGQLQAPSLLSGLINIELPQIDLSSAQYWTSTGLIDVTILGTYIATQSFYSNNSGSTRLNSTNLLQIKLLGLDILKTDFKNVRCVRN